MRALKARTTGMLALLAGALALAVALGTSGQVSAATGTIRIGSATIALGAHRSVALDAVGITSPGLGAWSIDITYDPAVISVADTNGDGTVNSADCTATGGVCNPNFAANTVRVAGASATGRIGDSSLALINFQCAGAEGSSALTISIGQFADGTLGSPQPIDATIVNGTITCQAASLTGTVKIGSGSAHVGESASVDLQALGIPAPGLGAWTVDISYDPTVVSAVDCTAQQGGVCNPAFAAGQVRVTGANIAGVAGDNALGNITFRCGSAAGSTSLALSVQVFVDSTVGNPNPIEATTVNGTFTCSQETAVVIPTPTVRLVSAGSGGASGFGPGDPQTWLIAGLIGAGIAWLLAGLAGVSVAAVAHSGVSRARRPFGREDSFVPRLRPRGSAPGGASGNEATGAGQNWFVKAREDLAGTSLGRLAGLRRSTKDDGDSR